MDLHRVLVVDDDPLIRNAVGDVLEKGGYAVDTHDSGFGLIVAIRDHRPDLVLLDVSMPGLRGDLAVRALQELTRPGVPRPAVALFSGMPEDELRRTAAQMGLAAIHKPVGSSDLLEQVALILEEGRDQAM